MDEEDVHQDNTSNNEHWLNNFEQQCLENWGDESNLEDTLINDRERAAQKLWLGFQNTATSITQLYKDKYQGLSLWIPFQNAASAVTTMYKDNHDIMKKACESSHHNGRLARNREIVSWVKKKCRYIRRDELLAFVCGKSPPPMRHRLQSSVSRQSVRLPGERHSPRLNLTSDNQCEEPDLQPFRDALILQGLNGAMSNVSVEYLPHSPTPSSRAGSDDGLNRFILDQLSRQNEARKRSASSEHIHESPNRKRSRFL